MVSSAVSFPSAVSGEHTQGMGMGMGQMARPLLANARKASEEARKALLRA